MGLPACHIWQGKLLEAIHLLEQGCHELQLEPSMNDRSSSEINGRFGPTILDGDPTLQCLHIRSPDGYHGIDA